MEECDREQSFNINLISLQLQGMVIVVEFQFLWDAISFFVLKLWKQQKESTIDAYTPNFIV